MGNDESIPEDVLNLDELTADTLTVSYCPFPGWDFCSFSFVPRQASPDTLFHTALWHP